MNKYYITTPIYYVNGSPHIGSALTTIAADVLARYQRMRGLPTHFLTGTDENATKVVEAARAKGEDPMAFVDRLAEEYKATWKRIHIEPDDFIRTTEPRHVRVVQEIFSRLRDKGAIYKDVYEGWYSIADETFLRDSEVADGVSIETGRPVTRVSEENYFFRLSAFSERLLEHYRANPDFWQPDFRANEVVQFIKDGLRDMCITRRNTGWGISVPGEPDLVIYVWLDALINYISATGWPDAEGWQELWPADVHLMAKEIFVRFHATLWPAMLMALELPLPEVVFGHGWLTVGGAKGGKSSGNLPHPVELSERIAAASGCSFDTAADALRYISLAEMRFGEDSEYTYEGYCRRFNSDLANDLGNALNRTLAMAHRYIGGVLPDTMVDPDISSAVAEATSGYSQAMAIFRFDRALESVWALVAAMNRHIDERAPWNLMKEGKTAEAGRALYSVAEGLRITAALLSPFMPFVADEVERQLGMRRSTPRKWEEACTMGLLRPGHALGLAEPIFPRIDLTKEATTNMEEPPTRPDVTPPTPVETPITTIELDNLVSFDEFKKLELRVARITSAEPHPNANKLLRLVVDVGGSERQLVAGIAGAYEPDALVGKLIVIVANLKPAVIRGVESQGMLLAATVGDKAILLTPDQSVPPGSSVK